MKDRLQAIVDQVLALKGSWPAPYFGMLKQAVRANVPADARILEIGPGSTPCFRHAEFPNATLVDYFATAELVLHYQNDYKENVAAEQFETIDYVCKDGDVEAVLPPGSRFDLIFSSHNLEHQHDLLAHLRSLERLLAPGGALILIAPDKRCTFDALRLPSQTVEVLQAHLSGRRSPFAHNVFAAFANSIVLNPVRAVRAEDPLEMTQDLKTAYLRFMEAQAGTGDFVDFHNWVFTPESLNIILVELLLLGKTRLYATWTSDTYGNEFMLMLTALDGMPADKLDPAIESQLAEKRLGYYRALTFGGGFGIY